MTLRHAVLSTLLVAVTGILSAGCQLSPPTGPSGPTGTLRGTLQAVGGPAGRGPRPIGGHVTLHGSGGTIATVTVGASGQFSVPVTVGTYTVSGTSPQFEGGTGECHVPQPVRVAKRETTTVQVDCQVS